MGTASSQSADNPTSVNGPTESTSLINARSCSPVSTNGGGEEDNENDTVVCPTCRGTGSVRRRDSKQLIALIPYKDKRLKKRRAPILYVVITLVVCLVTAGLLTFFLLPRSVTMNVEEPSIVTHTSGNFADNSMTATVNFTLVLTNNNYVRAHLTDLTVQVMQSSVCVGNFHLNHTAIDMITTRTLPCSITLRFRNKHATDMLTLCQGDYRHHGMTVIFQSVAAYQYLSDTEGISHSSNFELFCFSPTGMMPTKWRPAKPTTAVATTVLPT